MLCPFTGCFVPVHISCVRPKIYSHIVQVANILCQTKRWFAFSKIGSCASTKVFEEALNKFKCLGQHKTFLEPVKDKAWVLPWNSHQINFRYTDFWFTKADSIRNQLPKWKFKKEPVPLWITKRHNHFTLHCGIPTNFLSDDSSIFFFFFSVARKVRRRDIQRRF